MKNCMGNNFIFPFQLIEKGSSIILYGAGTIGQCFYKQLKKTEYARIVRWVDQNWRDYQGIHYPVESPDSISNSDFDFVVIAIDNLSTAKNVSYFLNTEYAVPKDKIIHSTEYSFLERGLFESTWEENPEGENFYERISPREILTYQRLDLIVRYLLAKDILSGIENQENTSLYARMLLTRSNAREGQDYFSAYERNGTREFIDALAKVCQSMRNKGFDKQYAIPVGKGNLLLNGAHRSVTALALEEQIWVKHYEGLQGTTDFVMDWFEKNGFSVEDRIRILRGYADLHECCGILLFFGSCIEQWNYLQSQVEKEMTIVGTVELDFSDNYIAYENLLHEIYEDPLWRNVYVDRKLRMLKLCPLKMRVLLVSDENYKSRNLYHTIAELKLDLRDRMRYETDIAPIVLHGTNSREEFQHLKQVILSVNNLRHLRKRVTRNYTEGFIERLNRLKNLLHERGVSQDKIVIAGSSAWEIFGLRTARDIDFIVDQCYRGQLGTETSVWEENIEYTRCNSIKTSAENVFADDLLIHDDNYHFMFHGLKFVNIDLIAKKKLFDHREKDIRDVRLYELFKDFALNFDNKSLLKKQIENEFYKKR